jgi:hypothetical protein
VMAAPHRGQEVEPDATVVAQRVQAPTIGAGVVTAAFDRAYAAATRGLL